MEPSGLVWTMMFLRLLNFCHSMESPAYEVVHLESDFQIRLYRDSTWMSAPVENESSFLKATLCGFRRLLEYINGANLKLSRIPMTAPALTSIVSGAGPFHSSAYIVKFYLPQKFESDPPSPLPHLKLKPYEWDSRCVAARKFSGFATNNNVAREAKELAISLSKTPWAKSTSNESDYAYSVAQYNSPFHIFGRTNEVWVDLDASEVEGCSKNGVATY